MFFSQYREAHTFLNNYDTNIIYIRGKRYTSHILSKRLNGMKTSRFHILYSYNKSSLINLRLEAPKVLGIRLIIHSVGPIAPSIVTRKFQRIQEK